MLDIQREQCVENISFILLNQLLAQSNASFEGLVKLKNKIRNFVANQSKIQLLLPAFPCKTNNLDKVLGHKPDMGEYLVLRKFVKAIRDIQAVYDPGVIFYIFSDYHTFSNYISVDLAHHYDYSDELRKMVESMNCSDSLKIVNFEHFTVFDDLSDDQYHQGLKDRFGDEDYEKNFDNLKLRNNKMNSTYLGLKKFMNQDQKHILSTLSYKERRKRLSEIAKGMMVQGKALDNFLQQTFSECIRLSIHEHPMVGKKFSLFLFNEREFKTPWHSTMMFDACSGKFLVDTREKHLKSDGAIVPVTYQNNPWCYIRLTAVSEEVVKKLAQLQATLYLEKTGLVLECTDSSFPVSILSHKELSHLIKEFGSVVLRGFDKFASPSELEAWYGERGAAVPWKFGNVRIIKCQQETQPIQWDLLYPPSYMGITQDKYSYEDFTPNEIALYCHQDTLVEGNNENIIIDSVLTVLSIDGKEREKLRETVLRYSTEESQSEDKTYPLIMQCPRTRQDTFRWWQTSEMQCESTPLTGYSTIEKSDYYDDIKVLEHRLYEICTDPRVGFRHQFVNGDVVMLGNHTSLTRRANLKTPHELWHIQLQPNSVNSPWQPHNKVAFIGVS